MRKYVVLGAIALSMPTFAVAAAKVEKPVPVAQPTVSDAPKSDPAPAAQTPTAQTQAISEKVASDWMRYDIGNKGHLSKDELAKWLSDLRVAAGEPAPDANWKAAAFVQTDTNADQKVSPEELTAFLSAR